MRLVDYLVPVVALVRATLDRTPSDAMVSASATGVAAPTAAVMAATTATAASARAASGSPFAPTPVAVFEDPVTTAAPPRAPSPSARPGLDRGPDTSAPAIAAQALAQRFDHTIDEMRRQTRGNSKSDIDAALFAMLAWADEALILGEWPGATHWQRFLLQKRYFNTTTAGVGFFTRLEDLRDHQSEVREVYALCLSLGFRGRFAFDRTTRLLDEKRRDTVEQVLEASDAPASLNGQLFPEAYASELHAEPALDRRQTEPAPRARISRRTLMIIGVPLVILAVLYATYSLIIAQMVNTLTPMIK